MTTNFPVFQMFSERFFFTSEPLRYNDAAASFRSLKRAHSKSAIRAERAFRSPSPPPPSTSSSGGLGRGRFKFRPTRWKCRLSLGRESRGESACLRCIRAEPVVPSISAKEDGGRSPRGRDTHVPRVAPNRVEQTGNPLNLRRVRRP